MRKDKDYIVFVGRIILSKLTRAGLRGKISLPYIELIILKQLPELIDIFLRQTFSRLFERFSHTVVLKVGIMGKDLKVFSYTSFQ